MVNKLLLPHVGSWFVFRGTESIIYSIVCDTLTSNLTHAIPSQERMEGIYTWEASSFSVAGTSSTTKGFPSSLHIAARYIRGLKASEKGERKSTFFACTDRPKGRKSLSGTVRKAAMLDFIPKYARVEWQGNGQGRSLFSIIFGTRARLFDPRFYWRKWIWREVEKGQRQKLCFRICFTTTW